MAVQGAAPNKMAPAKYSLARSVGIKGANTTIKKNQAITTMVKGLINQFTAVVITSPFGWRLTLSTEVKSTCTIMGKIIPQINTPPGINTCANQNPEKVSELAGQNGQTKIPQQMQTPTIKVGKRQTAPRPPPVQEP